MPSKTTAKKQYPTPRLFEEQFNNLHSNCLEGSVEDIQNFFKRGNKIQHYDSGLTPLHVVVLSGRKDAPEVIDILMDHGVDIDATSAAEEKTALHLVTEHGDFPQAFSSVVKLLERGADTTLRDRKIRTAYDLALARNNQPLATVLDGTMDIEELQEFYYKKMAEKYGPYLTQAIIDSDEEAIRKNIDFHADPNILNQHGAGAIHYCITHCNLPTLKILKMLIAAGADVNIRDHENDTALNLAIKTVKLRNTNSMSDVVSLLLKSGADQTFRDLDDRNAYDSASKRGYSDIMSLLTKPKASKREDSFVAQPPIPETPRRQAVERTLPRSSSRSPSKSPTKTKTQPLKSTAAKTKSEPEGEQRKDRTSGPSQEEENIENEAHDLHEEAQMFKEKSEKKKSGACVIL